MIAARMLDLADRTPDTQTWAIRPIGFPGGHRSRVTPVPIPNTEVKPATADGTAWETAWESRSLPGVILEARCLNEQRAFFIVDW